MVLKEKEFMGFWATLFTTGAAIGKRISQRGITDKKNKYLALLYKKQAEQQTRERMTRVSTGAGKIPMVPIAIGVGVLAIILMKK